MLWSKPTGPPGRRRPVSETARRGGMSTQDNEVRAELKRTLDRLAEGKRKYDELAGLTPDKLVDAVADLDRATLEKIVLYRLLRGA